MNKKELQALLLAETGSDEIQPGYNYTVLSVQTRSPWAFRDRFREVQVEIESRLGIKFLPVLCRSRSVLIPVPWNASLNETSSMIAEKVKNVEFRMPLFG